MVYVLIVISLAEASRCVMSRGSSKGGKGGGLDLKLHLSPPAAAAAASSDEEWSSSSSSPPPSSCLSSSEGEREPRPQIHGHGLQWSDSPEATPMVLAACPRCLMYVMLSEADPRCPRCRSPVLLDFLHHAAAAATRSSSSINVSRREDGDHSRSSTSGAGGRRNRRA
jgi:hypothetical protein